MKMLLPEDWLLGLLKSLKVGDEVDLLEEATEDPRMRLLVKRTGQDRLVVIRKPSLKSTNARKKSATRIIGTNPKGKVLYDSKRGSAGRSK